MPELRWTLLVLGALFIVALAIWELRRQRQARGDGGIPQGRDADQRVTPTMDGGGGDLERESHEGARPDSRGFREPTLTFPEVHLESRDRGAVSNPPVVEMDDESLAGLKVDRQAAVDEFTRPMTVDDDDYARRRSRSDEDRDDDESDADESHIDEAGLDEAGRERDTRRSGSNLAEDDAGDDLGAGRYRRVEPIIPELSVAGEEDPGAADVADPVIGPVSADGSDLGTVEPARKPGGAPATVASPFAEDAFTVSEPIVDWPDEDVRRIVALRLVSGAGERFQGRAVRLALAAEGFVLGKFDIFHKPGPDSRAILSAASLTKPGTFSLGTMDAQRYGGLSLFAVLPGPLAPVATFDELLTTARSLNDRLRGALQDERGEPLTPVRSASIRESLSAGTSAVVPTVGPASAGAPAAAPNATTAPSAATADSPDEPPSV
jgi:FtsZ-interacting cell division protein ZipA